MKCDRNALWMAAMAAFLSLTFLTGCQTTTSENPPTDPQAAMGNVDSLLDKLQVGNKITITVTDIPEPKILEETIGDDGYLTLPFNERIFASGKTKRQIQDEIIAIYVPKYFTRMTISIKTDDRYFSVLGEVRNPSRQPYVGQMTVLKAIASAGGFTEFAKKTRVDIIRPGVEQPIRVNASRAQDNPVKYDLPIFPNDQIVVRRRIF